MKLTDALLGEHAVIYDLFDYVRDRIGKSDGLDDIQAAVSVLDKLLLNHAEIEETLLFPNLEPHLGQQGPLAVMRAEHEEIIALIGAAKKESDVGALKSIIGQLLDLAHGHFEKEEGALFPMARQFLDEETLTALGEQWATNRKVNANAKGCTG